MKAVAERMDIPASWKPKRTALLARLLQPAKSLCRSSAMVVQTAGHPLEVEDEDSAVLAVVVDVANGATALSTEATIPKGSVESRRRPRTS